MTFDTLLAAGLFAIVSYITPGPNNAMILASSVNFGLRRSMPHLLGICLGFGFMLLIVGLGLHGAFSRHPAILQWMRYAGAAYLLWLAWRLATAVPPPASPTPEAQAHSANAHPASMANTANTARPLGFLGASAFQWINPKAWVMAMTAMTAYLPAAASLAEVLLLVLVMTALGSPCVLLWAAFGSALRHWLQDPVRLRIFNVCMALGLVASLYPILVP